ncbi:EI24 domain-containing protein [Saccharopolyspora erythraea]|uniref:EI24 domain-containing protein n=1 Tax=Saccharopolyspora erythraea TaxID=1836 RepID=UPI001BA82EA8|nr:EI24 domain-containing protein [Saccharopolyspora erythraea]QUH00721.1 EI24 domain-containing protein [Saccharopolyspora erythraea]
MNSFVAGVRTLGAGFGMILRSPKLLLLGAIPALISALLLLGSLGALVYFSGDLATAMTPFADGWAESLRGALRLLLALAMIGAGALLGSVTFIALTLLIGGPFYEHIAEKTEERLGLDTSGDGAGLVRELGRGVRDSLKLLLIALVGAIVLFVLGFIPVVGQIAAPVLGGLFGAWVVTMEMVGLVFQRRGLSLADRRRTLGRNRAAVLGFGLPTYLLCLVPIAQLVVIPSAVVGGTMLAHRFLGPASPPRA